jgi:hypothetical protein
MLASTVQFSTYDQSPTTSHRQTHTPTGAQRYDRRSAPNRRSTLPQVPPGQGPLPQDPTACLRTDPTPEPPSTHPRSEDRARRTRSPQREPAELVSVPPSSTTPGTTRPSEDRMTVTPWARLCTTPPKGCGEVLLRKEVIQPHLPVRLPCYDFVPIADPAFDGSLHKGWATGFGRYRLS